MHGLLQGVPLDPADVPQQQQDSVKVSSLQNGTASRVRFYFPLLMNSLVFAWLAALVVETDEYDDAGWPLHQPGFCTAAGIHSCVLMVLVLIVLGRFIYALSALHNPALWEQRWIVAMLVLMLGYLADKTVLFAMHGSGWCNEAYGSSNDRMRTYIPAACLFFYVALRCGCASLSPLADWAVQVWCVTHSYPRLHLLAYCQIPLREDDNNLRPVLFL